MNLSHFQRYKPIVAVASGGRKRRPAWTEAENLELVQMAKDGVKIAELTKHFRRNDDSIRCHLFKLKQSTKGL